MIRVIRLHLPVPYWMWPFFLNIKATSNSNLNQLDDRFNHSPVKNHFLRHSVSTGKIVRLDRSPILWIESNLQLSVVFWQCKRTSDKSVRK